MDMENKPNKDVEIFLAIISIIGSIIIMVMIFSKSCNYFE